MEDETKWGIEGVHPCVSNAQHGTVCKIEEKDDTTIVYCSHPNGCGYVIEASGVLMREGKILVGIRTLTRDGLVAQRTERIPLSKWNSLSYLQCCIDPDVPHKWRTNAQNLPVI